MRKLIILTSIILFFSQSVKAQYYEITYDEQINNPAVVLSAESKLYIDTKESYYYKQKTNFKQNATSQVLERKNSFVQVFRKNFSKKEILYSQSIGNQNFFIKESIPLQRWELLKETKKIGNYLCKKAKTIFRGREYIAWFTEELPIIGGPWKFDGLSGIILEVASTDGFFALKLRTISYKQDKLPNPPNEIKEEDAITWESYCNKYKESIKKWEKAMAAKAEPGDEIKMTINTIEDMGIQGGKVSK